MKVKQHRTDCRKTTNDALITLSRACVVATFWLVPGVGVSSRSWGAVK